ncbi:MAG: chloride channel protein [Thermaerobacterales bacterium]
MSENIPGQRWGAQVRFATQSVLQRVNLSPSSFTVVLAILIGIGGGLFAVLFRHMIEIIQFFFFQRVGELAVPPGESIVLWVPAVGGLLVGPLIYFLAREAKGHGVPEVMEAVARSGGRIRPRVVFVKSLASALTIGTGGSVGREGPIVQTGSALGSAIGQFFKVKEMHLRTLVGCGAAAGIAATYNAPIAGVFFALEIILSRFSSEAFSLLVVSSVTASVVAHIFVADTPVFVVPAASFIHWTELFWYILLGVAAALVGRLFIVVLYKMEDLWEKLSVIPQYLHPMLGGLVIGGLAYYVPAILGVGYPTIEGALHGEFSIGFLFLLLVAKIVATSITLGSGGSGGVFAPSLFLGSALGAAVGIFFHALFPATTAASGAYALVGMGALFAATAGAPMTATLTLFELTRDYRIILPLMLAVGTATLVSRLLAKDNIYTLKLLRRGINLSEGQDVDLLRQIKVGDAMTRSVQTVSPCWKLSQVIELMQAERHTGFPVVDKHDCPVGMITLSDIRSTPWKGRLERRVEEVMSQPLITIYADDDLHEAAKSFSTHDVGRLVVVDRNISRKLVGLITRSDVLEAYRTFEVQNESADPTLAKKTVGAKEGM